MDAVVALILSCSLHPDDALVSAFIQRVSGGNVYFVGDLATVTSHDHVKTLPEALALVDEIERQGGRPAVGLMAVPVAWASRYGRSREDLFDGCVNIAIATDAMTTFESDCSRVTSAVRKAKKRRRRRLSLSAGRVCILRRFDLELGVRGYPEGVLSELAKMARGHRALTTASSAPRGRAGPHEADEMNLRDATNWSSSGLYFSSPTDRAPR